MNKNIVIIIAIIASVFTGSPLNAQNIMRDCKPEAFNSITLKSVGNIVFTQSDNYSCRIEGAQTLMDKTKVSVQDQTLVIEYYEKNVDNKDKQTLYISAPDLNEVLITGVGNFTADETLELNDVIFTLTGVGSYNVKDLNCKNLQLKLSGVGNMNMNIDCHSVNAILTGVGKINLSGEADSDIFTKSGVGKIHHKGLKSNTTKSKE